MTVGPRPSQIKGTARGKAQMWDRQNYTKKREMPRSELWVSGGNCAKRRMLKPEVSQCDSYLNEPGLSSVGREETVIYT